MTTEQKHEIEIPGLPEGWRAVAYRNGKEGESVFRNGEIFQLATDCNIVMDIIVEKIKPRRIVLEETDEDQPPNESQWLLDHKIGMFHQEKKWRAVEEE